MDTFDAAVIGGGPAGMAAALSAASDGARVLLLERSVALGGILNQCTHKGFGLTYFGEELTGQEYARRFVELIEVSDVETLTDTTVTAVNKDGVLTLSGAGCGFLQVLAGAVIIASGCREKAIGALPVIGTRPAGVFTAGAAQKMLNLGGWDIGERIVILGSGDVGMIVARELVLRGKEVVEVVEKADKCGGLTRNRINCLEKHKIPLRTRMTVNKVHGTGRITGVTVVDLLSGNERFVSCDTLITSVGLIPERELIESICDNGLPDHVFLCGNACYVHDTVDDVTLEAERVGRTAAEFSASGTKMTITESKQVNNIATAGNDAMICIACPKSCAAVRVDGGWRGLLCGRSEPVLAD